MSADLDIVIGRNLTRWRGEMSQQSLADAMRAQGWKWSQATVWAVEKGERPLKLAEAKALQGILAGKSPLFDLTQDEEKSVISVDLARVSSRYRSLEQAAEAFLEARQQLKDDYLAIDDAAPRRATEAGLPWLAADFLVRAIEDITKRWELKDEAANTDVRERDDAS